MGHSVLSEWFQAWTHISRSPASCKDTGTLPSALVSLHIHYFSVAVITIPQEKARGEKKGWFPIMIPDGCTPSWREGKAIMGGGTETRSGRTGRGPISFLPHTGGRELEQKVGQTLKPSKLTSSEELPSAKSSTFSRCCNHPKQCHQPGTKCPKWGALYGVFTIKPTWCPGFSKTCHLPLFWNCHLVGAFLLAD